MVRAKSRGACKIVILASGLTKALRSVCRAAFNPQYGEMAESLGAVSGLDVKFISEPLRITKFRPAFA